MGKEQIYQNLMEICEKKLQNDPKKEQIYQNIKRILSFPNSFEDISFEVAMNILSDLGFSQKQATEVYKKLID